MVLYRKYFCKPYKPCHVGIHWKALRLAEYSQMSTHMPGFQSSFRFLAFICIGQISHRQHKGYYNTVRYGMHRNVLCNKNPYLPYNTAYSQGTLYTIQSCHSILASLEGFVYIACPVYSRKHTPRVGTNPVPRRSRGSFIL